MERIRKFKSLLQKTVQDASNAAAADKPDRSAPTGQADKPDRSAPTENIESLWNRQMTDLHDLLTDGDIELSIRSQKMTTLFELQCKDL